MYCMKCGSEIKEDESFCSKCGAKVEKIRKIRKGKKRTWTFTSNGATVKKKLP